MASYLGNSPDTILKVRKRNFRYVATGSQTVFSGNDSNGLSLSVNTSDVEVFLNGVLLDQTDYTITTTTLTLSSGAAVDDIIEVITNVAFSSADQYSKEEVDAKVSTAITNVIGTAGAALNTLGELSDALNDDANFASTITTALSTKANQATTYTKTEVDNSLATKANTSSLATIASSGSASDLLTGTLPIARINDGAVTSAKLASGAAINNIGYTPTRRHGHSDGTLCTSTGTPWLRIASVQGRFSYRVTVGTTGGWYGPGMTQFMIHRDWGNTLYVSAAVKLNSQYCTQVRANSPTADQDWFIEVNFVGVSSSSGNASTLFDAYSYILVEPMGANTTVYQVYSGTLITNPSSAGYISGPANI